LAPEEGVGFGHLESRLVLFEIGGYIHTYGSYWIVERGLWDVGRGELGKALD
jgi:hypothetical protein